MIVGIIGYGRMGHEIEKVASERGHQTGLIIDLDNLQDLNQANLDKIDVALEFSTPETAFDNIVKCFEGKTPVVSGTTGWLDKYELIKSKCLEEKQTLLVASNFNIGVNILFALNKKLARFMNGFPQYEPSIEEIHHTRKLDAPSGTAIHLGEDIISLLDRKKDWKLDRRGEKDILNIHAVRKGDVPGIHQIKYESEFDEIILKHTAASRKGFALGAILAAEFIRDKTGVFTMNDLLGF